MKFKRLMALAMAGVMTLAMAGTALAADEPKIEKTIQSNEGVTIPDTELVFSATLQSESPIDKVKPPVESVSIDNVTFKASESGKLTTESFGFAEKCTVPGEYVFLVKEENGEAEGWTFDTTQYYVQVLVKNDETIDYKIIKVEDLDKEDAQKQSAFAFNNIYTPNIPEDSGAALTIKKTIDGSEEYSLKNTYDFTVEITYTDLTPNGGKYKIADGSETDITVENKKATITGTLKKDDTITFTGLPQGISYTITENETPTSLGPNFKGCSINEAAEVTQNITTTKENVVTEETFTFKNVFEMITPTGLAISVTPFVAMFAAVAGAIALYVAAKRRVR